MSEVQVGDIGTEFRVTLTRLGTPMDISASTVHQIIFSGPRRISKTKTADFVTNGADGALKYVTSAVTDIDEAGTWRIQAYIELPSGKWHSVVGTFIANENL